VNISSLLIEDLLQGYAKGAFKPEDVLNEVFARMDAAPDPSIWIHRVDRAELLQQAKALQNRSPADLPLYGIPFAIKDNIDLAGAPTTAACREFAFTPQRSATAVQKLIDAGALAIGKTNLDQFAAGLNGTRSPFGACQNAFDARYISGGSSSGSSVAAARQLVSFALGTDTAGSGRVPAGFNNLIGHKPTRGLISTRGVLPACRSLDCVSIFTLTSSDAVRVLSAASGFDAEDEYSRADDGVALFVQPGFRFGVPAAAQLQFFGDDDYRQLFENSIGQLQALGGVPVEIDLEPFVAAARLLYDGPWIAERYVGIQSFMEQHADALHPVTRQIIERGKDVTGIDAFRAQYQLMQYQQKARREIDRVDVILTPTSGTIYTIEALQRDPVTLNSNLGYYTNFLNLFDLAATAVPSGFRKDGLPFGITLIGPANTDRGLLELAHRLQRYTDFTLGATLQQMPAAGTAVQPSVQWTSVAVCGAHMEGLPLNHQLVERGGRLLRATRTAPCYRLFALPGGPPYRPGLMRDTKGGSSIEVEVWAVPTREFGSFVAAIPAPLGIGKLELEDRSYVSGFICEGYALDSAQDITASGGWRAYLAGKS
jgi:allophanate hydrolase